LKGAREQSFEAISRVSSKAVKWWAFPGIMALETRISDEKSQAGQENEPPRLPFVYHKQQLEHPVLETARNQSHRLLTAHFHPLIAVWFEKRFGRPTDLQAQAWPLIASGEHTLITAPTGSGKTLAAFLWAIHQLVSGNWSTGHTSVLYVSPLKALNNDIQRNLMGPLDELRGIFERSKEPFPAIRVATRSGDTPPSERRRMIRQPPEILITTPESLNLLLSSTVSRSALTSVLMVILDEIHAVAGTKRGVHLITAVDRLVPLSGEFQRIALSATIEPPDGVAAFVGGLRRPDDPGQANGAVARPVRILRSSLPKQYEIRIRSPEEAAADRADFWDPYVKEIKTIIQRNRSTLVFANSRRLCERLTHLINMDEESPIAYTHHGSLSKEIRTEVERRLKAGELRAIVATSSLELGIDIGALDEVILVQSPPSLSSAAQRIGRSGHQVGQVSRGTLFPTHPQDMIAAVVAAQSVLKHEIEPTRTVDMPLDVLAQVIISMAATDTWDVDDLFEHLKTSYPYRNLDRRHFNLVLDMLAGRYAETRVRELDPRISLDRIDNTVTAKRGAAQALYLSGGTIPDRGYFHLRHHETNAKIGELDEEFVWEASVGQVFTLGTQNWRIERITHNDVFVLPARQGALGPPFWRAEEVLRDFHFSERMGLFLEMTDERLDEPGFQSSLVGSHLMSEKAAQQLITQLSDQKAITKARLPHRHHLLVEHVGSGPGGYPGRQIVLHTLWGGRVNRPFALALAEAWEARFGHEIEIYAGNDCLAIQLPHPVEGFALLRLVTVANVQALLQKRLEHSGFFGARFRECASRALLLTRRKINERMPLWLSRLRSQKLLGAVLPYEDFPILLETWRTCLKDELDMTALLQVLTEIESGAIAWSETFTSRPSPMAHGTSWAQLNQYVYMDDQLRSSKTSRLRGDLVKEMVLTPALRPAVSPELVEVFERKRRRLDEGYPPESAADLLDWLKERLLLPISEWDALLKAAHRDHGADVETMVEGISHKVARIHPPKAREPLFAALERVPRILPGVYHSDPGVRIELLSNIEHRFSPESFDYPEENGDERFRSLLAEWMQFYGPMPVHTICATLGVDRTLVERAVEDLIDADRLIFGRLVKAAEEDSICDAENFSILLRLARVEARPSFEARPIRALQLFLAGFHGMTKDQAGPDALLRRIEQLACYPAPAAAWESEILPARFQSYDPVWVDALMQEGEVRWLGTGDLQLCFYLGDDLDLMAVDDTVTSENTHDPSEIERFFVDPEGKYDFSALLRVSGASPSKLSEILWEGVWNGKIANDTFLTLRRGMEAGFKVPAIWPEKRGRRGPSGQRHRFSQWKAALPFAGNWYRVPEPDRAQDPVEEAEKNKDRVRLLLDRYGVLFRELLLRELPAFRWSAVFRTLRLMELSGEVLTGYFFRGVPGPQFISHEAFRILQEGMEEHRIYWISATDPASLCGLDLAPLKDARLPRRVMGTHLVYRGTTLLLVSRQNGKKLTFRVPPDDPQVEDCLEFLRVLLTRQFKPLRRITLETINGEAPARSPYLNALRTRFDVSTDHTRAVLYTKQNE
jgi:ATP-dependent Lhr-like helicase